jgi:hypothetical protein
MLAAYLEDGPVRLDSAGFGALHESVPDLFDRFLQGRMIPLDDRRPLAVKTHLLPGAEVLRRYRDATGKILYLVRNPRDLIPSAERFLHVDAVHRRAFAEHFIAGRGVESWRLVGYGTWPQHVREWTTPELVRRHFPRAEVHVVRYEDMKADPAGVLGAMVSFLGFDESVDRARVERAVRNSSLDTLRAAERRERPREPGKNPFFGQGRSDQPLSGYGEGVEEAYRILLDEDAEFSAVARQFGYAEQPARQGQEA